jgi:hypothetical protein
MYARRSNVQATLQRALFSALVQPSGHGETRQGQERPARPLDQTEQPAARAIHSQSRATCYVPTLLVIDQWGTLLAGPKEPDVGPVTTRVLRNTSRWV